MMTLALQHDKNEKKGDDLYVRVGKLKTLEKNCA